MRKIVVSEFISLDGIMEGPGPDDPYEQAGWTLSYGSAESMKVKLDELMASDSLLLGKSTYEGFAQAWPGRTDEAGFGDKMNSMKKYVVSDTLETAEWNNTEIVKGTDVVDKLRSLKQENGGDILINGSAKLINAIMQHNLVDVYRLLVFPIILGTGKRLFNESDKVALELVKTQSFEKGVVLLEYSPTQKS